MLALGILYFIYWIPVQGLCIVSMDIMVLECDLVSCCLCDKYIVPPGFNEMFQRTEDTVLKLVLGRI